MLNACRHVYHQHDKFLPYHLLPSQLNVELGANNQATLLMLVKVNLRQSCHGHHGAYFVAYDEQEIPSVAQKAVHAIAIMLLIEDCSWPQQHHLMSWTYCKTQPNQPNPEKVAKVSGLWVT